MNDLVTTRQIRRGLSGSDEDSSIPKLKNRAPRRPLLSIAEVADYLGVNVRHVRRLVTERRIPYIKWGHLLRFDPTEIDGFVEQARVPPTAERRR